jgi:hypothetical protein
MAPGIGAAGILGIAFEDLAEPVLTGVAASGGSLTAGTYKYYLTAINAAGETNVSNEVTVTTATTNLTAHLTWVAITGATGYKVYRTAAGGATGTELLVTTLGLVTSYDDTAVGAPAGALPTTNTAYTPGTYTAPTKFVPFMSESLTSTQATIWRRPIRQSADVIGAVAGDFHVAGEISSECFEDVSVYWLAASRNSFVKTGTTNYTYTFTPTAAAIPTRTLSITTVRNGIVFGFTGCVVSSNTFNVSDGILHHNVKIVGRDEAVQSVPVPTWPTTVPFGAGSYSVEIPTASPVFDTDNFEYVIDDAAEPQFRLKNTTRGADFIKYGERKADLTFDRDFQTRTDFDAFKALTSDSITITASKGANNSVSILSPVTIKNTYEVSNSGQGDLVRASIKYVGVIDGTGKSYQVTIKTQENI